MKKIHLSVIWIWSGVLALAMLWGGLHLYADRQTLPEGVRIGGVNVGGMDKTDALRLVEKKLDALKQRPLLFTDSDSSAQDIKLTLGEAGFSYKAEAFRNAVKALSAKHLWTRVQTRFSFEKEWSITPFQQEKILKSQFGADWEEQRYGMPINAVRQIDANDQVRYIPGRSARRLDWPKLDVVMKQALPKDFTAFEEPIRVELPFHQLEPKITVDRLRSEGIERKITQFSTSLGSSSKGRVYNVNSAASTVDGLILKPGDIFDYGQVIAKAERTHGFREAPVIVNGRLESGIGGGICQVSSTVYNAALRVGLDIVERRNHSLPVSYLPKGQDATFATGSINFRFRNNTGKHLLLRAAVQNRTLTVKIFGTFPSNIAYELESHTVRVLPIPVKRIRNDSLPSGFYQVIRQGKEGYVVETFRIKKVDGKPVERTRISRDTYRAQQRIIASYGGSTSSEPQTRELEKPIVEDGISE
ncbi:VanW family protein [Paenibacillus polymyxa]|uniref:VanW family protein n=2 Tax=Paenibacillus TaxID=44249 RepID=UPI00057814EE|nr:VanW family protein [Paenibacillus polymyxa]MEE4578236.1 VanW family protein [Paenibacillus polymyxa]PNQ85018.1 vancomycin resistance protein [Paenibacillus polymyxa]UNL94699.1 vancomycin resistance protein [Paenibacillus polymyxa]UQQ34885.1 VanW family protein [Paenibacillus polymyxa]